MLLILIGTSRGSDSIYRAIEENQCDFNVLEQKQGKGDLQICNVCCNITTKKGGTAREAACYGTNYMELPFMHQFATNCIMGATKKPGLNL